MKDEVKDRRSSKVWQLFTRTGTDGHAKCELCGHILSYKSSTTNLAKHVERKHQGAFQAISATEDDPREGLKEFITLENADGGEEEGGSDEALRDGDTDWTPPKKMLRKSATTSVKPVKVKPELISSNGVDYLIYTHDQAPPRQPATQVLTKVQTVPQRPALITSTPSAPKAAPKPPPPPEEDEFSCFARFLSKRIRALKDPYWQSCAINEINSALHKVEMRRYEPPRAPAGSDFSVQTDPLADHIIAPHISSVTSQEEQRIVEEIVEDVVVPSDYTPASTDNEEETTMCPELGSLGKYEDTMDLCTDAEFKSQFRMERSTFNYVLNKIEAKLRRSYVGAPTISPKLQLMVALWKMARMDPYRLVCQRFNVGRATALRAVGRVMKALFALAPSIISWPNADTASMISEGFKAVSGFPGVLGAVDATHIRIKAPPNDKTTYMNDQGYCSLRLQLVCDHQMNIIHAFAGLPGSFHDHSVLEQSEVSKFLNDEAMFPGDTHLVGDAAYEDHPRLLKPFEDIGFLTEPQKVYNARHAQARMVIERCLSLLRHRMSSLREVLTMHRVDVMPKYIIACCVLHNICLKNGDELDFDLETEESVEYYVGGENNLEAYQRRDHIMQLMMEQ